jgi:hypothetical protein
MGGGQEGAGGRMGGGRRGGGQLGRQAREGESSAGQTGTSTGRGARTTTRPGGLGLRPDYRIPRKDRSWRTTEAPGGLPLSFEGYVITAPRSLTEETAFQHLMKKGMLFRAPETGPDRCREPHFRFAFGEPTPDSERADRRRGRSPGGQEAAGKRHRD